MFNHYSRLTVNVLGWEEITSLAEMVSSHSQLVGRTNWNNTGGQLENIHQVSLNTGFQNGVSTN